jgi:hypothetical protein
LDTSTSLAFSKTGSALIEHDPDTDTVRSLNEPPPGTVYQRV